LYKKIRLLISNHLVKHFRARTPFFDQFSTRLNMLVGAIHVVGRERPSVVYEMVMMYM